MAWIAASIYEGMQITCMQASVKFETSTQIPLPITSFFLTGGEFSFRPCCDMHSGKGPQTRTGSGGFKVGEKKKSGSDRPVGPRGCVSLESRRQEGLGVCSCERTTPSPASYMRAMCAVTNPFIKHAGLHGRAACTQCPSIWPLDGGIVQLN